MKKRVLESLLFWWIIAGVVMLILGFSGIVWDKQDWIFLFLVVGLIVLNIKLNKLLSKEKKS